MGTFVNAVCAGVIILVYYLGEKRAFCTIKAMWNRGNSMYNILHSSNKEGKIMKKNQVRIERAKTLYEISGDESSSKSIKIVNQCDRKNEPLKRKIDDNMHKGNMKTSVVI